METIAPHSMIMERMPAMAQTLTAHAVDVDKQGKFPTENIETLGKLGLMGLVVPEAQGGAGASEDLFSSVLTFLAESCASTAMVFLMHCCGTEVISKFGTKKLIDTIIPEIVRGKHLSTLACSESGTGANFYATFSDSKKSGGGYTINARKAFVTSGGHADSYVLATRADGAESCLVSTLYMVPRETKGVSFEGTWDGLGMRGNSSVAMQLNKTELSSDHVLGKQEQGLEIEMSTILPRFLLGTASVYAGIAQAALQATTEHLKSRTLTHNNQKLADMAVLRRGVAEMQVAVRASRAVNADVAKAWDYSGTADLLMLMEAKQLACRTAIEVAQKAMQLCGGIAYARQLPVERHLRDAMAGAVMAPTDDMLLDFIGRGALGLPLMD